MLKSNSNTVNLNGSLCFITFKSFEAQSGLRHAFSTRLGGVSGGYFGKMNLSFKVGDQKTDVLENYRILCENIGIDPAHIVLSQQTHTANVRVVGRHDKGKGIFCESDFNDVDGLITNEPGVAIVTHSADCCLLAFYDPEKRVIAASHAGWRGTVAEIGRKTIEKMVNEFGCSPENILCAIAPSICKNCYEVDYPLFEEFSKLSYLDLDKIFKSKGNGKFLLDLWEANRQILTFSGIKNENIEITDICSCCNAEYLHSHRASGGKRGVNGLIMELIGEDL
ncbi:MAG: peptidoglycan editing factor PgeF [Clostridiales bacterium]|nr:peptidoglycan editing factor PgeF [Candidatus Equinaster intestinalis]